MQAAPQESCCSQTGILWSGVGLDRATISSGAWWAKRSLASTSSRPGSGLSIR